MGKQARQDSRAARLDAIRDQQRRGERRRALTWIGAAGALVLVLGGGVTWAIVSSRPAPLTGRKTYPNLSRNHVTGHVT